MRTALLILLVAMATPAFSCSCDFSNLPWTFCNNTTDRSSIITVVVEEFLQDDSMQVRIIDVIHSDHMSHGQTLSILGGNGANCIYPLDYFTLGDTVIMNLSPTRYDHFSLWDCQKSFEIIDNFSSDAYRERAEHIQNCISGINSASELEKNVSINIYPNPTIDLVTIASDILIEQVSIFDQKGERVYHAQDLLTPSPINLVTLAPAVYYIRLQDSQGNIHLRKIVKN